MARVRSTQRRFAHGAMLVLLSGVLSACLGSGTVPAEWVLSAPPDGSTLELEVAVGLPCNELGEIGVLETTTSVRIQASVVPGDDEDCPSSFEGETTSVQLSEPLGDRILAGCRPGSDETIRFRDDDGRSDEDCA